MSLTLVLGCMFSGKTEELMRRVGRYRAIGWEVLVVNSEHDTRCGEQVRAHTGEARQATKAYRLEDVNVPSDVNVIAIDEAQFFGDLCEAVLRWVDADIHVVVSGLNGDYQQRAFGQILQLIPHAEEIVWKTAYCAVCCDGTPACFSSRIDKEDGRTLAVGGSGEYVAVCRKHK